MNTIILTAALALAVAQAPGDTVRYEIAFPNAAHHEAEITIRYDGLPATPLDVRMSRSSPGRYALHEFAKNVYDVRAVDGAGRELAITRPDPHTWRVNDHGGAVTLHYTLFADRADGTYSGIDRTHGHLNMPATFAWGVGTGQRPIRITFHAPAGSGWRVATQLAPTADAHTFTAPDLYYFLDSPTEVSDFDLRAWEVESGGRTQTIRLAMHHLGMAAELDAYADWVRRVVLAEADIFGELPAFDYGTYTFIADYLPWVAGDGMEHRNSTILTSTGSLEQAAAGLLGTVSHEFVHAWNVERIRPRTLEPFDFTRANMSDALWFAEGFTSYYTPLAIRRAGISDDAAYAAALVGTLNTVINAPGRRYHTLVEMSMQAPFVDAATSVDPVNRSNTFISYYTWGAGVGLGLDLALRTRFPGVTLDDFMRAMWARYGKTETPYTLQDWVATLAEVSGDAAFAAEFFERYVAGREVMDYETLLASAGILLRSARPDGATLGPVATRPVEGGLEVTAGTLVGTPLYEAGVDLGDLLVSLDGTPLTEPAALGRLTAERQPRDTAPLVYESRGKRYEARVTFGADDRLEVLLYEDAGMEPSAAMLGFREAWLGTRLPR